jgi:hypothetical protein
MLKFIIYTFSILSFQFVVAQQKTLADYEKELNELSIDIVSNTNEESKIASSENFKKLLLEALQLKESFDYPFKNIKAISILKSNDKLKIYNWALPLADETYQYFAILQIKLKKDQYKLVELIDKSNDIKKPESQTLTDKMWYGALYYEIIYDKKLGDDTYTLLGWDGDYNLTNKKIIDAVTISSSGAVKFGSPIFKTGKKAQKRVLFTYAETAVMSLKYHPKDQRIIFDFLVPTGSNLEGVYEYYGPSLNRFDAYFIDKNHWEFQKDVDVQQDKNLKDRFYKNPN